MTEATGRVWSAAFSPDGQRFVTASDDGKVRVYDTAQRSIVITRPVSAAQVFSAIFSPDARRILTASGDATARVFDAASGAEVATLSGHEKPLNSAAFSADGARIVTASEDKTVRIWDGVNYGQLTLFRTEETRARAQFSPDGRSVIIADGNTAKIIPITRPACGGPCSSVAFSDDGAFLLTAGWGGKAQLWVAGANSQFTGAAAKYKGRHLVEFTHGDGAPINHAFFVTGMTNDPTYPFLISNGRLMTVGDDGAAILWRFTNDARGAFSVTQLATIRGHDAPVTHAAATADGRRLVTADLRGAVRVTNLADAVQLSAVDPTAAYERHVAPAVALATTTAQGWAARGWTQLAAWVQTPTARLPPTVSPTKPARPEPMGSKLQTGPSEISTPADRPTPELEPPTLKAVTAPPPVPLPLPPVPPPPKVEPVKLNSSSFKDCTKAKNICGPEMVGLSAEAIGSFAVSKYAVTFDDWDLCVSSGGCQAASDNGWGRGRRPVINVSWLDARGYAAWLTKRTGQSYRLLSEAEWEIAANAGADTTYSFGNDQSALADYAWFAGNSGGKSNPVGGKLPNALGLYDMNGNVWQWIQDCDQSGQRGARDTECSHVMKGGGWADLAGGLATKFRYRGGPDHRSPSVGIRMGRNFDAGAK